MILGKKLMVKVLMMALFVVCVNLGIRSADAEAKIVVGLVDMQKVLLSIDEGKGVRKQLEDDLKKKQDSLKKDENKFKDLQDKFEKQRSVLNESKRTEKEKELRDLYVELQEKTMKFQQDLQDLERTLKKPLIDKIKSVVETVSKTSSVDLTFEVGTTPLVYAETKKDITEDVISAYNKQYPSK
ncbi:MAG: OmpH family outer membrane protein [Oligoflexia bacterium]|nr:OmpH family outer membrane protein [Oligoflexia bacterium]MBF0366005.1 OmpH family outer membrane protein [Oligoflexia bacterium]